MKYAENILERKDRPILYEEDGFFNANKRLRDIVPILSVCLALTFFAAGEEPVSEEAENEYPAVQTLLKDPPAVKTIYFDIRAEEEATSPNTRVRLELVAAHICEREDELRIEKFEIHRDDGTVIATLTVPEQSQTLPAIGALYKRMLFLQEIRREIIEKGQVIKLAIKDEKALKLMHDDIDRFNKEIQELDSLIRKQSFCSSRRDNDNEFPETSLQIDLKDFKGNLKKGDKITVHSKGYFLHEGQRRVLEKAIDIIYR